MLRAFRTLYVAFVFMVSRRIFLWTGEHKREVVLNFDDNDIQFNPPPIPSLSNQSFNQGLLTHIRDYYDHLSYLSWPSFVYEAMFLLGTISTAWQVFVLIFKTTRWIYSIRSPSIQSNKRSHTPTFKSRDDIKGWLSMFERHHQDLSDNKKGQVIVDFLSPEVNEELESFLLKEKPRAGYQEIRKALLRLFAKHETIQDPIMSLVSRTQHEQENLFQYMGALKRLSREAFEKEMFARDELIKDRFIRGIKDERIKSKLCESYNLRLDKMMELASEWESKLKKTDTVKYKPHINKLATVESGDESSEPRFGTDNKRARFYSISREDSGRISSKEKPENSRPLKILQLTKAAIEHVHSKRPDPIRGVCKINNQMVVFDLDTGADVSALSETAFETLNPLPKLTQINREIHSAGGIMDNILGLARVNVQIGKDTVSSHLLIVKGLTVDCLLGRDLLPYSTELKCMSKLIHKKIKAVSDELMKDKNKLIDSTDSSSRSFTKRVAENLKAGYKIAINCIKENLDEVANTIELFKIKLSEVSASCLLELKKNVLCPIKHKINLINPFSTPIRVKVRRVPYHKRMEFKVMLDEMLEAGLIQKSESPWSSPVLLVSKPDGSIRFTVDYSKLNNLTIKDAHPLPNAEDMFALLANSKWYTKLDLYQGFYQIPLDDDSKKYTAFACEWGLYEYNVMPMGLTNAPATFQRMMNNVLRECIEEGYVSVFLDDILIHSSTLDEHFKHLSKVVEKLRQNDLKVKLKKCELVKQEVTFLGHVISYGRIKPDPSKVEALHRYPRPTNLTQVQSFLGLAQYYRKFIEFFSAIAAPLYFLTSKDGCEKDGTLKWSELCEKAFNQLRSILTSDSFLVLPDMSLMFRLDTDACNSGVGAVLSQFQDGAWRPIGYFSRGLNKAQKNYSTTEKELLAIVLAIEYFHQYLYGHLFEVYVDHQPLSWLLSCSKPNARLARWLIRLGNYDFKIIYRSGKKHCNADALSRWSIEEPPVVEDDDEGTPLIINVIKDQGQNAYDYSNVNLLDQSDDPDIQWIIGLKQENVKRSSIQPNNLSDGQKSLLRFYEDLTVIDDKLYQLEKWENRPKLVLAKSKINMAIELVHSNILSGHLGTKRTKEKLFGRFFRPKLGHAIDQFIRYCEICQKTKTPGRHPKARLNPILTDQPLQLVTMDIVGPLPTTTNGSKYILVICCHFSKFVVLYFLTDQTAETIVEKYLSFAFLFGFSTNVLTDLGTNFQAEIMQKIYELLDVYQLKTSAYHPECNGLTERFNRTLKTMLSGFVDENQNNWDKLLGKLVFAYNVSIHSATGYTPYELMFGRKPKLPIDLVTSHPNQPTDQPNSGDVFVNLQHPEQSKVDLYLQQLKEHLAEAFAQVKLNRDLRLEKTQWLYNRNIRPETYNEGELVLKNVVTIKQGLSKKLAHKWEGPFIIVKKLNDLNYQVRWAKNPKAKARTVHHNRLKRFFGPLSAPNTPDEHSSNEPDLTQPIPVEIQAKNVKKRGRPKKMVSDVVVKNKQTRGRKKKKPGRPRKIPIAPNPPPNHTHPKPNPTKPRDTLPKQVPNQDPNPQHNRPARNRRPVDRLTYN